MKAKRGVKIAISLAWYAGDSLGRFVMRLAGRAPAGRLVILYYHAVPTEARPRFAQQMDVLACGGKVVSAGHVGPVRRGERCVAITFDDAFRSVADQALPELVRRSLPSTVFVPVRSLGQPSDWATEPTGGSSGETVMTADELRSLPELVELGSHSLTHPHLKTLDAARLADETAGSRRELEKILDARVTLFSFPYGEHDRRVVQACLDAGYERLFSIVPVSADPGGKDFVRGRVAVDPNDGPLEFYLKMRGAYAWMAHVSAAKRTLAQRGRRP